MKEGWQSFVIAMLITCGTIGGYYFLIKGITININTDLGVDEMGIIGIKKKGTKGKMLLWKVFRMEGIKRKKICIV